MGEKVLTTGSWLAMEDLNNATNHKNSSMTPSISNSAQFADGVVQLKHLLEKMDPETSPLRAS